MSRNMNALIPRVESGVITTSTQVSVHLDGTSTVLVNGSIRQSGLELFLRVKQEAARYKKLADAIEKAIEEALNDGIPNQEGNRLAVLKELSRATPSYRQLYVDARQEQGWEDDAIDAEVKAKTSAKVTTKLDVT
jgi:hypothetical protein